jgi:DNA repair exonuclease SbcCD ATPase subunit
MPDLNKLDSSINKLDELADDIQEFSSIYSNLIQLKNELNDNQKILQDNSTYLNELKENIKQRLENYDEIIKNFDLKISAIRDETISFKNNITDIISIELNKIKELNKILYNELEENIKSKLEKNKSDIQVEIRNEGIQIQRGFDNTINKNFNEIIKEFRTFYENLLSNLNKNKEENNKKLNRLNILGYIIVSLILVSIILHFVKI